MKKRSHQNGITLLITLLLVSVLLAIISSLLNITIKQFQISGIARESQVAFQAANAGIECALYHDELGDLAGAFNVPDDGTPQGTPAEISCMGSSPTENSNGVAESGEEQQFQFDWGTAEHPLCTKISVYKFQSATLPSDLSTVPEIKDSRICNPGYECTVIVSRGYNAACSNLSGPRVVERELTQVN